MSLHEQSPREIMGRLEKMESLLIGILHLQVQLDRWLGDTSQKNQ